MQSTVWLKQVTGSYNLRVGARALVLQPDAQWIFFKSCD